MEARNLRKERTGVVVSNKMDKTITVAAKFKEKHPIYGKFVSKTKKYHAHDGKERIHSQRRICMIQHPCSLSQIVLPAVIRQRISEDILLLCLTTAVSLESSA